MDLIIKGGRIVDLKMGIDEVLDVYIKDAKISSIQKPSECQTTDFKNTKTINAHGKVVVPGLIDVHTHLREPGYEHKETIKTGTHSAAAGGFTAVCCMANTNPVNDNKSVTQHILEKAHKEGYVKVYPIGAISKGLKGKKLADFHELKDAGVVAISDDGNPVMNSALMSKAMEYAKELNLSIVSHCEDIFLSSSGMMHEGLVSNRLGLKGIPSAAEAIMVARDILLSELTDAPIHIAHVSTEASIRLIRQAKKWGLKVTAETAPHYFTLTDEAVTNLDTNTKMNPPLRSKKDVEAIKEALADGTIDVIATDHAPHHLKEKDVAFDKAKTGIVGLETALPLTLKLIEEGVLTLGNAISKLTCNPARILKIEGGSLMVGKPADITLIDLERSYVVDIYAFKSKSKNSPFHGWKLKGKAILTIVDGQIISKDA